MAVQSKKIWKIINTYMYILITIIVKTHYFNIIDY